MPAETKEIDYVMEAASGPHFSGLRLDSLMSAAPSSSTSRSSSTPTTPSFSTPLVDSSVIKQPFVIGVSGGTASGKTTVCDMIIQQLHDHRVVLVNQDSFYRGLTPEELERVHEYNFDHPDAFDTEQLLDCVNELKSGHSVHVPMYDFKTHQRSKDSFRQVNASDVIILEGILVFHDQRVRNLMNMKIFVDTDADVRLARRIRRDTVERGRDISSVLEQYAKFVKPAFEDFVLPSKKHADVIIPRGGDNHVAIDLIVQHIRTKLGQHDLCKIYPNVYVIQSTFQIRGMHTLIRDQDISKHDFVFYSDRLIRLVVEHGLGHLPFTEKQIVTPTGLSSTIWYQSSTIWYQSEVVGKGILSFSRSCTKGDCEAFIKLACNSSHDGRPTKWQDLREVVGGNDMMSAEDAGALKEWRMKVGKALFIIKITVRKNCWST
ncbi:uridine kinase-like protein 1, chloroplastic isoform X3 [Olea europaea var. sylvestris]|uniref:uridine kinase-like protein 1, chloroplastic isoform X3 n=1 Tax=Olea europaea var. sylvestris TaxID=158386 RepID=UPI000C1D28F1|nr:uridine kinase-like protein 1, chloroplastic isoform X3 [Olea europaea var. sylvestris]